MAQLRRFLAMAVAAMLTASGAARAACAIDLKHRAPMVFTGRLAIRTFPGSPNFEDVRRGDQPEPTFILTLDRPLCAIGAEFSDGDRIDVDRVHLVPGGGDIAATRSKLRSLLGRRIEVQTRDLFEAHTGHHHAPIVAEAASVSAAP